MNRLVVCAVLGVLAGAARANEVNPISVAAGAAQAGGKLTLAYTFDVPHEQMLVNALELTYSHSGKHHSEGGPRPALRTAFDAFGMSYKASYAFGALGLQGRLGLAATQSDLQTGALSASQSRFGFTYGVGVSYQLSRNWSATVNADRLPVQHAASVKGGANLITIGLNYQFD